MASPKFFNPFAEILKHGEKLPHWQQPGATYFVTFRLADSIPQERLSEWREERELWLKRHPEPLNSTDEIEYHRRFSGRIDKWLDEGAGECVLRSQAVADCLGCSLSHFDGEKYLIHTFVIMPNHVHVLVSLREGESLESHVRSWKGVSARHINQLLGRSGALWQKDYFDRLIRGTDHFYRVARYIRTNPEKARLPEGSFVLKESDTVQRMLGES
ncbi:MAG: transposase [Verrucomicrobiales bacterium]|nr:transposase [Verrucomicrobiales bacterium]